LATPIGVIVAPLGRVIQSSHPQRPAVAERRPRR
jgi:hypothetical protein